MRADRIPPFRACLGVLETPPADARQLQVFSAGVEGVQVGYGRFPDTMSVRRSERDNREVFLYLQLRDAGRQLCAGVVRALPVDLRSVEVTARQELRPGQLRMLRRETVGAQPDRSGRNG